MRRQMNQHPYDYAPSETIDSNQHFETMKKMQIEQIQNEERLPFQSKQELKGEEKDKDEQKEEEQRE